MERTTQLSDEYIMKQVYSAVKKLNLSLEHCFRAADADDSGTVSCAEFSNFLAQINAVLSDQQLAMTRSSTITTQPTSEDVETHAEREKSTSLPDVQWSPGEQLDGGYELIHCLAEGGMGRVLRIWDHKLDQSLAMKIIRQDRLFRSNPQRFAQEARIIAALDDNR